MKISQGDTNNNTAVALQAHVVGVKYISRDIMMKTAFLHNFVMVQHPGDQQGLLVKLHNVLQVFVVMQPVGFMIIDQAALSAHKE